MEVVVPAVSDFHFDSCASSPYVSAPSSPKRFGRSGSSDPFDYYYHYASAPTSPSRVASILASSSVPFDWEETPGTPRPPKSDDADDFAFDFSGQLEKGVPLPDLTAADELFEEGMIRPLKLKLPPRLYNLRLDDNMTSVAPSPRSPKSPNRALWSPRARGKVGNDDPFTAAMVEATRERGREKRPASTVHATSISSSRSRKGSRSLSPMRSGAGGFFTKSSISSSSPKASTSTAAAAATVASECLKTTSGGSRKWRLRDLLLFRSASEGRVTGNKSKDPLRKYTIMPPSSSNSLFSPRKGEDSRNSSFRSTDSGGASIRRSTDGSIRRAGSGVSAHEMHYMSNRAASEEKKKKTALPFNRQGLFGCLRFNPAVHSIAKGFHNS